MVKFSVFLESIENFDSRFKSYQEKLSGVIFMQVNVNTCLNRMGNIVFGR